MGKIFGLTAEPDAEDGAMDGILGGAPWSGRTLDLDEVDDVIEAIEDTIAVLSDVDRFGREYEDQIATINEDDNSDHDAADFFNGLMSRIRFGSTSATRFGAYVVKEENDPDGDASDGARGGWTKGVFAYTPSDALRNRIPDRGEATFRGSTVQCLTVDPANRKGATLYAGDDRARREPEKNVKARHGTERRDRPDFHA